MAALTLTNMDRRAFATPDYFKKATLSAAGYVAFLIPPETKNEVLIAVTVTGTVAYMVRTTLSSESDMSAGTHSLVDEFDANQTTSQVAELPPAISAVQVELISGDGSVVIEARAK